MVKSSDITPLNLRPYCHTGSFCGSRMRLCPLPSRALKHENSVYTPGAGPSGSFGAWIGGSCLSGSDFCGGDFGNLGELSRGLSGPFGGNAGFFAGGCGLFFMVLLFLSLIHISEP